MVMRRCPWPIASSLSFLRIRDRVLAMPGITPIREVMEMAPSSTAHALVTAQADMSAWY